MPARGDLDPAELRRAVLGIRGWLEGTDDPGRPAVAAAVRLSAQGLAQAAPGNTVELRVPPFVAVQCIAGPQHTRGTPPNVVETDPRTWLELVTGLTTMSDAETDARLSASGNRAGEIAHWLPLLRW